MSLLINILGYTALYLSLKLILMGPKMREKRSYAKAEHLSGPWKW